MATTFAMAYLVCVLMPPVALAFVDGAAALHCLSGNHHHKAALVQADDAKPHHAGAHHYGNAAHHHATAPHDHASGHNGGDGNATSATCCGLFCVSAMPMNPAPDVSPSARILSAVAAVDHGIAGRGPERIDRPPIVLLSH